MSPTVIATPSAQVLARWRTPQILGEPGNAIELRNTRDKPGFFHTPHGIWVYDEKVFVSDRENNRIQIFTLDGAFLDMWLGYLRPTKLYVDAAEGVMYVSELDDRISIVDMEGNHLGHLGAGHVPGESDGGRSHEPGSSSAPRRLEGLRRGAVRRRGARGSTPPEVRTDPLIATTTPPVSLTFPARRSLDRRRPRASEDA